MVHGDYEQLGQDGSLSVSGKSNPGLNDTSLKDKETRTRRRRRIAAAGAVIIGVLLLVVYTNPHRCMGGHKKHDHKFVHSADDDAVDGGAAVPPIQNAIDQRAGPPRNCKVYYDGCNNCARGSPGDEFACTEMYCENPEPAVCLEYFVQQETQQAPKNCKVYYDGCNTCQRSKPGSPLGCTRMFCREKGEPKCEQFFEKQEEQEEEEVTEEEASPISANCKSYFDGCNNCARSKPGGPSMCTLKYCKNPGKAKCNEYFDGTEQEERDEGDQNEGPPANCQVYFDGCNNCRRGTVGGPLACTRMFCRVKKTPKCLKFFD